MEKQKYSKRRAVSSWLVFFAVLLTLIPISTADEGVAASGSSEGGFFSGVKKGLSGFKNSVSGLSSGLPGIFSELSPADVGVKPRVKPHFVATQGFHSNANLGEGQGDPAWQARIAPGIGVSIPSGKLYTEVDYTYGFSTTQGRRTSANVNTHNLNVLGRYELSEDTIVGVGNNLQISELPGQAGKAFWLDTATSQISHRLSPKLMGILSDTFQWFKDSIKADPFRIGGGAAFRGSKEFRNTFVDNGVGIRLNYDALEDLTVGPDFRWNVRHYDSAEGKSYWQISPNATASYKLGPKTTVEGNLGWVYRSFDEKTSTTVDSHESELVYGATVSHLLGTKFVWSVGYAKTLQDTFDTNFIFRERPEASAAELDDLDRQFRVLKSHRMGTNVAYRITERQSVDAFTDASIVTGDKDDNVIQHQKSHEKTMQIGAGYSYRVNRYITLDIHYVFGRRFTADNNAAVGTRNEYTFHKVTGGLNVTV